MADYAIPKNGAAYIFYGCLVSQADTKLFKSAPTIAAGDFKVSTDGAAFANLATLPTNTPGTFSVKFSLSAGEMTGDNILVVASDAAGAEWCDQCWNIQTSVRGVADLATPTNITAGTITTVGTLTTYTGNTPQTGDSFARIGALGAGLTAIGGLGIGAITAASFAANSIDATALATTAVDEIRDGVWAKVQVELTVDPGATPTVLQAQMLEYMAIRNLRLTDSAGGTDKIHNNAGTVILTATVSDSGTLFTKAKYA